MNEKFETLGDYGRLDNLDEVPFRFQLMNPITFNIKNHILKSLKHNQFFENNSEDWCAHHTHFSETYDTINQQGVSESDKRLRLFVYSLGGYAKGWLNILLSGTIATCDQLMRQFLDYFFPTTKYLEWKHKIANFKQQDGETLYYAWKIFMMLLKRCPGYKFHKMENMQAFTTCLKPQTRMFLDASTSGTMNIKSVR